MHQAQWSPARPLPPPVTLASQSHHEKPPEVTCTSRGNPGFPASTRERPRETFFNTSRGQIPLPWLGSNDALPLATRMETRLPWRPTRGSLTSPSYLVRDRTLGPPLENNPEILPSSRAEGLRLLHGLETNLATSLQRPMRALFSDRALIQRYIDTEVALAKAEARCGVIQAEAAEIIARESQIERLDFEHMRHETDIVGYPILPLVHQLVEMCGEAGRYVHWGATTQDIMDTAVALQVRDALDLIDADIRELRKILADLAVKHRDTRSEEHTSE